MDVASALFQSRGLADRGRWLLVLDNADRPDQIVGLLPRSRSGHVMVTTRVDHPQGFGSLRPLPFNVLPLDQATDFLLMRAGRSKTSDERPAAATQARELGRLPLALEQAGAYVDIHGVAFGDYLAAYQRRTWGCWSVWPRARVATWRR